MFPSSVLPVSATRGFDLVLQSYFVDDEADDVARKRETSPVHKCSCQPCWSLIRNAATACVGYQALVVLDCGGELS